MKVIFHKENLLNLKILKTIKIKNVKDKLHEIF